jgi:hypothetical protein
MTPARRITLYQTEQIPALTGQLRKHLELSTAECQIILKKCMSDIGTAKDFAKKRWSNAKLSRQTDSQTNFRE